MNTGTGLFCSARMRSLYIIGIFLLPNNKLGNKKLSNYMIFNGMQKTIHRPQEPLSP